MSKKNNSQKHCCFCGRPEEEVPFLFQGIDSWICSDCVEAAHGMLEESEREYRKSARKPESNGKLLKPKEIHAFLDQYVIGQDRAKKLLSVAV